MKHLSAKSIFLCSAAALLAAPLAAHDFNIPAGDLKSALDAYVKQAGVELVVSSSAIKGVKTGGVKGDIAPDEALTRILKGTGFSIYRQSSGALGIMQEQSSSEIAPMQLAQATPARPSVETVTVTSSKLGGADVQSIPISITALSQEQLTSTQTAGGPDLVKQVPNLTFSKTNFSGYNLEIRGIGTQAISVTTDPAVAVALNDIPFIRNHFFEQEFYDVSQVEVLRGPQGTLYGRNATAGVVNVTSAKPTDQFEAMASADIGNYKNRRFEGMINLPVVDDRLDLRVAGEWTKRDGYSFNETTGQQIDGRDLWSGRVSVGWHPYSDVQVNFVWEHFQEDDDRLRSGKQLCKTDPGQSVIDGVGIANPADVGSGVFQLTSASFSQGCLPTSLYSADAFQVPNGYSLPFVSGASFEGLINERIDPYAETGQSANLRDIQSVIEPVYRAKNDTIELNTDYQITPQLTFTSQTGYNNDFLWSTEDYNRFDTSPGIFLYDSPSNARSGYSLVSPDGEFCDPQLGCSDRLVVQDLSSENAWQLSQEFRLASHFSGPLNFSVGGNFLHYETEENYYVFANTFTQISIDNIGFHGAWDPVNFSNTEAYCLPNGFQYSNPARGGGIPTEGCQYIDPNPITSVNNDGHNYFLSQNPYVLNSYAGFGEAYYNLTDDLKLTGGLRWTDDQKHFAEIPSWLVSNGWGYPVTGGVDQSWQEFTGRFAANWTPKLSFTDQTLVYGSFAHGYKAGGANPPGPVFASYTYTDPIITNPVHPLTFKPEFINAFEAGTKNTLLDGALTLNGSVFFYDYKDYQISEIVDRTSVNLNFNAKVHGVELETNWEPLPGLKFSFAGGYEHTSIGDGQQAIDLIDRTAGHPGWVLMKPFVTNSSNCIFPTAVAADIYIMSIGQGEGNAYVSSCEAAYGVGLDPVTRNPYGQPISTFVTNKLAPYGRTYTGYDPSTAPNNGEGFAKDLGGNELPNAPHFTTSFSAEYTVPVTSDWAASLHGDFYWQSSSWARVFNDDPYDQIHGYTNVNLALILTNRSGWQVMGYVKNVFDTTAITGDFLNSDDSGLTTNIFLTDPRLFGVRITRNW
jgi:outer membrane receptor protein involved in Fe transport